MLDISIADNTVGAASQGYWDELIILNCELMPLKCWLMLLKYRLVSIIINQTLLMTKKCIDAILYTFFNILNVFFAFTNVLLAELATLFTIQTNQFDCLHMI